MLPEYEKEFNEMQELKQKITQLEEVTKIQDISQEEGIILKEGYELTKWKIKKQGKHYWGFFIVHKINGKFSGSPSEIGKFKFEGYFNGGCFLSNSEWDTNLIGYLYFDNDKIHIADTSANPKYNYAKVVINI